MIRCSFKCYGIFTEVDGSEDNTIFDFEKVLGKKSERVGIKEESENVELTLELTPELTPDDNEDGPEFDYYE